MGITNDSSHRPEENLRYRKMLSHTQKCDQCDTVLIYTYEIGRARLTIREEIYCPSCRSKPASTHHTLQ